MEGIKIQMWVQQVGWSGVPARESDEATASSKSKQEGGRQQAWQAQPGRCSCWPPAEKTSWRSWRSGKGCLAVSPCTGVKRKERNRKDCAFRRQCNEKPSIIPGCPVYRVIPLSPYASSALLQCLAKVYSLLCSLLCPLLYSLLCSLLSSLLHSLLSPELLSIWLYCIAQE